MIRKLYKMSCTPQIKLNNTDGASGADGGEWTEVVPSRDGSESTDSKTTVHVPKGCTIGGAISWAKKNWGSKSGQKATIGKGAIVLSGGTSTEREKTATVLRRLMKDWAKPTSAKTPGGKKRGKQPSYFAPAKLFYDVVKPLVEAEGFECIPLGKTEDGKKSRYGLRGKTPEERDTMSQQVIDHCAKVFANAYTAPTTKVWGALKCVAKELKGIRFNVICEKGDMTQYVLSGATLQDREDFAQAVGMTAHEMIEEEAQMEFYTVPADQSYGSLNQARKGQSNPAKWGGIPKAEHVEFRLRGHTDKTMKVSRYTISGGTPKSQAAFVAKVNSLANKYRRNDKAKHTAAQKAALHKEKEAVKDAKQINEQRDAESYFEREAARKAAKRTGNAIPKPRGSGGGPAYAGSGPAEENPFVLKASNGKKSKQEKQAARAVRAIEKQQREALEKQEAARAAAFRAEQEEQEAAEAAALSKAIAATNPFAMVLGVEEHPRTLAEEEVKPDTQTAPSGAWGKGKPVVKVVEQPVPKGKGKAKAMTLTADTYDDSECEDWEKGGEWFNE